MLLAAFTLVVTPVFAQDQQPGAMASPMAMPVCKAGDPVVWLNTKSKKYHMPGDPVYGKTKHGRYVCKSAADADGDKMAKMKKTAPAESMSPAPEPEDT